MDLPAFQSLLTSTGQKALEEAVALSPTNETFLVAYEKLRKLFPTVLAKAAVETAVLRSKARAKFRDADRLYFTRESLEVASGDIAADHRARRLAACGIVADLGCGIGGDSLAFARAGLRVEAVDSDELRLEMARANAVAIGLADRIRFHLGDALATPLPEAVAAFADPSRRSDGRRHLDPEDYSPPLSAIRAKFADDFPLAVKLAPGLPARSLESLPAEIEFVSVDGELKECIAWFGSLRTAARRASVLTSGEENTIAFSETTAAISVADVQEYIFDPDPAVVRAGLALHLAESLGLSSIDYTVALLTGSSAICSPFLRAYRIESAGKFHPGRLREHLRDHAVGRVTFIKRGSNIDSDALATKLKLAGHGHRVVFLARLGGTETMLIGERVGQERDAVVAVSLKS